MSSLFAVTHLKRISRRLRQAAALSWADRWLLVEVLLLLGLARLTLKIVPFRRIAQHLGELQVETSAEEAPDRLAQAQRIALAVSRISPHTPWISNCFPQALTAKFWLRQKRIPSTLYLGVALNKEDAETQMEAHAWLRCGGMYVTGGKGDERYAVVACFGGKAEGRTSREEIGE